MKSKEEITLYKTIIQVNHIKCFGNSMYPFLIDDDIVYFKPVQFAQVQVNDIILIYAPKKTIEAQYIIHRVIYKTKRYVITKGDNNNKEDPKVYANHILGKVTKVKRNGECFDPEELYFLQSSLYFKCITKLVREMTNQGIDYILLKGLILHMHYQKTIPRRKFFDYDMLVRYKDFQIIHSLLTELGYKRQDTTVSKQQKKLLDKLTEVSYIKQTASFPVVIDLHFEPVFMMTQIGRMDELYDQKYIDSLTEIFFKKKQKISFSGMQYYVLAQEHLIVYLALHFFHHNFRGIYRLELLRSIILKIPATSRKKTWNEIIELINEYKLNGYLWGSIILLKSYFNTPIPKSFQQRIRVSLLQRYYTQKVLNSRSVFESTGRLNEGIQLFKSLFLLSPQPFYLRLKVLFNPAIIYMFVWSMKNILVIKMRLQKYSQDN